VSRIVSINVGLPREVAWRGEMVTTSIFKTPVTGSVLDEATITVSDIVSLYAPDDANQDLLRRASQLQALPEGWRDYFRKRLWKPDA
jgi:MOSC domain-containing protein YiiM